MGTLYCNIATNRELTHLEEACPGAPGTPQTPTSDPFRSLAQEVAVDAVIAGAAAGCVVTSCSRDNDLLTSAAQIAADTAVAESTLTAVPSYVARFVMRPVS